MNELIIEKIQAVEQTQVNVRLSKDAYEQFERLKNAIYLKGYNFSLAAAMNKGLMAVNAEAEVWLIEHAHLPDIKVAKAKRTKSKKVATTQ